MHRTGRSDGFTLIEIMAAVAIFALLAALIAPRVASISSRTLHSRAQVIAASIELGRQRAVVTGHPHRLVIDLEGHAYWLEEEAAQEQEAPAPPDAGSGPLLDLSPPLAAARSWRPLEGTMGDATELEPSLSFGGVETPGGWVERGEAWVDFERDGTASETEIYLDDESGRGIVLVVLPLSDGVRFEYATS